MPPRYSVVFTGTDIKFFPASRSPYAAKRNAGTINGVKTRQRSRDFDFDRGAALSAAMRQVSRQGIQTGVFLGY